MVKYPTKSRTVWQGLAVLLLLMLCMAAAALPAHAANPVQVGIYELEGFHSFESDGTCVGYDVDYLNRIANVTGWSYEYVKAESWADAMEMLRTGQIDLLSPSQMTTERLEQFKFSTFPIGKVYAAILQYTTAMPYRLYPARNTVQVPFCADFAGSFGGCAGVRPGTVRPQPQL